MGIRLSLVCHGATIATRRAAFPRDEALETQARARAGASVQALRRVDVALTSATLRARQTAEALRIDATIDPLLADLDCGRWAGYSLDEVEAQQPGALAIWTTDTTAAPHGGETVDAFIARQALWLETVARLDGHVVAIAHAATLRATLSIVLAAAPQSFWRIDVQPLSALILSGVSGRWTVRSLGPLAPPSSEA